MAAPALKLPPGTDSPTPGQDLNGFDDSKSLKTPRLTHDEQRKILKLRHVEGLSIAATARAMNRAYASVYAYLQPFESTADMASAKLAAGSERAADAWLGSLEVAAAEGNHRPAQALLEAVGVVKAKADMQLAVQVNMPGARMPQELIDLDAGESPSPPRP